jgi:hypothetical protein
MLRTATVTVAVLYAALQIFYWVPLFWNQSISWQDTWCYYKASRAVLDHRSIYIPLTGYTPQDVPSGYLYFPPLAVLLAPLAALGPVAFSRGWLLILVAAYWTFAWSLSKVTQGRATWQGTLVWGLAIACIPSAYHCLSTRNADIIVWALVGLAFSSKRTASLLAVVVQIKPYALAALALFLWDNRARWREVAVVLLTGFVLSLCAGWGWPLAWYRTVSPVAHQGTFWEHNVSLPMTVLRIFDASGWHYPPWLLSALCLSAEIAALLFCLRLRAPYRYAVLLCLSALAQPLCWDFYLTSGLVIVAMAIRDSRERQAMAVQIEKPLPVKAEALAG